MNEDERVRVAEKIESLVDQFGELTAQYGPETIMQLLNHRTNLSKDEFIQKISTLWDEIENKENLDE